MRRRMPRDTGALIARMTGLDYVKCILYII